MVFMGYIREGTDTTLKCGPLLTSAGALATGLTVTNAQTLISKVGGALTAKTGTAPSEDGGTANYSVPVTGAADVSSTGRFEVQINNPGALPWRGDWAVIDAATFDSWVSGTSAQLVELTTGGIAALDSQIQSSVTAASSPPSASGALAAVGAINTPTAGQQVLTLDAGALSGTNRYVGQTIWIGSGLGIGQARPIRSQSGLAVTIDNLSIQPAAGDTYIVDWGSQSVLPVDIANISNLDATVSSRGAATDLATALTNLTSILARLPAALVSGRMDASVGAMAANTMTAAAAAPDLTTELQSGLATAAGLSAATANLDVAVSTRASGVAVAALPDAAGVSAAVWDEAQAGHTGAGTFGAFLDAAVSGVSTGGVSAADIADAVLDEALSGHVVAGSLGESVAATLARLPAALIGGRIDATLGAVQADAITAAGLAADVTTELQNGLATAAALATAAGNVTNIQSRLPAALVAGRIDANVGAMGANTMTASAAAADLTAELQSGLATAAGVTAAVAPLATAAGLTAATANLDTSVSSRASAANLATANTALVDLGGRVPAALVAGRMASDMGSIGGDAAQPAALVAALPRLDVAVSSRSTYAGGAVLSVTNPVTVATVLDKAGYGLESGAVADIVDGVDALRVAAEAAPVAEPSGPIVWGASTSADILAWLGAMHGNPKRQTADTLSIRDADDAANLATAAVSDAGGVVIVGRLL